MRFGVLGTLDVVDGDRVLDSGAPKQRAVLALLLLEANRVVSLDRLIDLLWGEEAPARATASLQVYVSNLRRVLEPGRASGAPPERLLTRPPGYLLRVAPDELDAARFEALAAAGARALADGRPQAALDALDEALALWRGPALAEFAYEEFAQVPAERWEELRKVAVEDRMEAVLALGGHAAAAGELEALTAEAPLRERRWALLMLALYRCGRQAHALRMYARARAVLGEELGLEPGPELARLEADILAHAPHLEWRPPPPPEPAPPEPAGVPIAHPTGAPSTAPIVGRDRQLAVLSAALEGAMAGRAPTVLVTGEAGIGKSRLLEELARRAEAAGAVVAWGRAHEGGGAPAFWPWVQVLRALLDGSGDAGAMAAAPALVQLLPELAERGVAPSPPVVDAETARLRLYDAVASVLHQAAEARPVVVLLDDLHWSAVASLAVTQFVATHRTSGRILLVATYRPDEVVGDHPLLGPLAALARLPDLERVALAGLPPADVASFVTAHTGVEAPAAVVDDLHARSEGNPFFLAELVRLLAAERSLATPGAVAAARIPTGVRDVVRRRLTRLPETSNSLLRVGAVIGREFELTVVAAAAEVDEEDALLAVEAALLIGVVLEEPGRIGHFRFAHALVQEALYEQLSGLRRARLHGQVGRALEAGARSDERLDEIAHHFFEAAPAIGPDNGFEYLSRAAEVAHARLAYEEAQQQLRRALQLVARMPPGPERAAREVGVQLRLAGWMGQVRSFALAETGAAWARAAELCVEHGLTGQLLGALSGEWIFAVMRGDAPSARATCERVVDFGRATGDPAFVMLGHFHLGYLALQSGDPAGAVAHLDVAITEADAFDDDGWLIEMFHVDPQVLFVAVQGIALWLSGREPEARAAAERAMTLATARGHPFTQAVTPFNACLIDVWSHDAAAARARSEEGIALTARWGLRIDEAHLHVLRGWAVAAEGDPEAGIAEMEPAMAEIHAMGRVMSRSVLLGLLADARRRAGRLDQALEAVDEALVLVDATDERMWEAELCRMRGELTWARRPDERADAERWLRRAAEVARAHGAPVLHRRAEESLARLRGAAGDRRETAFVGE